MAHYVDGFVLPVPRDRLGEYQRMAERVAEVRKEHGALDYHEFVGDDMHLEGTRSFVEAAGATPDDVVVLGWVTFASKEDRDRANELVLNDARMPEIVGTDTGFDAARMVYGGFSHLV